MSALARRKAADVLLSEGERFAADRVAAPLDLSRADRARAGQLIEALIALLDQAGGDPDMEDGDLDRCCAGEDGPISDVGFDRLWRNAA